MSDKPIYLIGIDPGVQTGYACSVNGELQDVIGGLAVEVERRVRQFNTENTMVFIEDARKRDWFGNTGPERWKGAGSIMRDCHRWQQFCEYYAIPFRLIAPKANMTKLDQKVFQKITGWKGRTNEHGRDAAMLIYGR